MTELDLSDVVFSGAPLTDGPLGTSDRLVIMGHRDEVRAALRAVCAKSGVCAQAGEARDADTLTAYARRQLRALTGERAAWRRGRTHVNTAAQFFGTTVDRRRVSELDAVERVRLQLAVTVAAALCRQASWLVLDRPFDDVPASARAGVRGRLLDALDRFGFGAVIAATSAVDAGMIGGRTVVLELDQLADAGDFGQQLAHPRSNVAADFAHVNVFSGLARRGWISIGHSQVRARTELEGKVFVTIPMDAVRLALDEYSPVFRGETVFEALVVGIREKHRRVQLTLSPIDTEVGLALSCDLFDFGPPADDALPWGVLHPALGETVVEQRRQIRPGVRLFVEVDTERMRAYPVDDAAPTAVRAERT